MAPKEWVVVLRRRPLFASPIRCCFVVLSRAALCRFMLVLAISFFSRCYSKGFGA